jgi:hypothetical protein
MRIDEVEAQLTTHAKDARKRARSIVLQASVMLRDLEATLAEDLDASPRIYLDSIERSVDEVRSIIAQLQADERALSAVRAIREHEAVRMPVMTRKAVSALTSLTPTFTCECGMTEGEDRLLHVILGFDGSWSCARYCSACAELARVNYTGETAFVARVVEASDAS